MPTHHSIVSYCSCLKQSFSNRYKTDKDVWTPESSMRAFVEHVGATVQLPACARVLDIGAGRGNDARFFLEKSCHVTAIDLCCEAELSALQHEFSARMIYLQGNFLDIALPPPGFALVIDNGCFHHQHPDQLHTYLNKVHACLSAHGVLGLNVFCDKTRSGFATHTMRDGRLVHVHDEKTMGIALRTAGFGNIQFKRVARPAAELDYDYMYVIARKIHQHTDR